MTNEEAIEHLKDIITNKTSIHGGNEEAINMAIAALEGKDIDAPTKEAIPYQWIADYLAWLKDIGGYGLSDARAVQSMLIKWKMEHPHSGCGPDYCDIYFGGGTKA